MMLIGNVKGYVAPSLGKIGKRHDSSGKKSSNWGGKRENSTKSAKECWTNEGTMQFTSTAVQEVFLNHELKMEYDLKEAQKDERKVLVRSPKKCTEEGSPTIKK